MTLSARAASSYADFKRLLTASDCRHCALAESRTQIVVDRGNPEAGILFIGEAPGANEDVQGQAFVGRAGKLLDAMLGEVGLDTNRDCLIANVVKCRPPANRQPKPEEAARCLPYLRTQIDLVKPKVILLLGAVAMRHLFPERKALGMAAQVGIFFEHEAFPGVSIMTLYHPAYIWREPRKRPAMAAHLGKLRERWDALRA